jgi:hypothetical protein
MDALQQDALYRLLWGFYNGLEPFNVELFEEIINSDNLEWFLEFEDQGVSMFSTYLTGLDKHELILKYFDKFIDRYPDFSQIDFDHNFLVVIFLYYDSIPNRFMNYFIKILLKTPDIYYNTGYGTVLNYSLKYTNQTSTYFLLNNYNFEIKNDPTIIRSLFAKCNYIDERLKIFKEFIKAGCSIPDDPFEYIKFKLTRNDPHKDLDFVMKILNILIEFNYFEKNKMDYFQYIPTYIINVMSEDQYNEYIDYFISKNVNFDQSYFKGTNFSFDTFKKVIDNTKVFSQKSLKSFFRIIDNSKFQYFDLILNKIPDESIDIYIFKELSHIEPIMMKRLIDTIFEKPNIINHDYTYYMNNLILNCKKENINELLYYYLDNCPSEINIEKYFLRVFFKNIHLTNHFEIALCNRLFSKCISIDYSLLETYNFLNKDHNNRLNEILYDYLDKFILSTIPKYIEVSINYQSFSKLVNIIENYNITNFSGIYSSAIYHNKLDFVKYLLIKQPYLYTISLNIFKKYNVDSIKLTYDNLIYYKNCLNNTKLIFNSKNKKLKKFAYLINKKNHMYLALFRYHKRANK